MRSKAVIGVFLVLLGVAALPTKTMPLPPLLGGMALLGGIFSIVLGTKRA
jgi:hypothetical protein